MKRTLSKQELEDQFVDVMIQVAAGKTFVVTHDETGEPVAEIRPPKRLLKLTRKELETEIQRCSN